MKKIILYFFILLSLSFLVSIHIPTTYAQTTEDEAREQRELKAAERAEEAYRKRPETAAEILKMLKERAEIKLKERRRALLKKTKMSAGVSVGFETNPLNDALEKGDFFTEENFSFNWLPTFNEQWGADVGYRVTHQNYFEQTDLSSLDQALSGSLKYYPWEDGKLFLQPGAELEWLLYPKDDLSTYEDTKTFLKFKHYAGEKWNWGGKYEYSYKIYEAKRTRDEAKNTLQPARADRRNIIELYITKYIDKYSVKLRGKTYRNNSNDAYQKFYDYDAYRGYVTISRSFLEDDKLYLSFTPNYERKNYHRRDAEGTARHDDIVEYKFDVYYTLKKYWTLTYNYAHKASNSNASGGEYTNITNKVGLTVDF